MEKVKRFFRELNEKRSYQVVFFVVSMCVVLGGYVILRTVVAEGSSHRYTVVKDKNLIKYVEEVSVERDILTVSGWCFYKDVDSNKNNVQVFLKNIDDEEDTVWLDVEKVIRDDVDAYYDCAYDYSQTGFEARTKVKKLDLQEKDYEIFLKISFTKEEVERTEEGETVVEREYVKTVSAKRYISDGKLTALKPGLDKEPTRTASMEINTVFDKGQLLQHREDLDTYIYQYGKKLYWVAGKNFYFEEDGTTYIQYQLDTTQADNLPKYRIENGWGWDNLGFIFEDNEMKKEDVYPYRIAVRDLPIDYSVTCFETGYFNDAEWIWKENSNIDIRLVSNKN